MGWCDEVGGSKHEAKDRQIFFITASKISRARRCAKRSGLTLISLKYAT